MIYVLYFILAAFALSYLWMKKRFNYWSDRGFLSLPSSIPFGSLKDVGTKITICEAVDKIYKQYKGKTPAVGIYFFAKPTLMPLDPELIKNILVRNFASFHDRDFYFNKEDDPTSANLLTLEGNEWRERRVKMSPIFTSGKMKMMFEIVESIGEKLIEVVEKDLMKSDKFEMRELCEKYTVDVIGNVAFGLDCKCLEDSSSEFLKHGRRLFNLSSFELLKFFFSAGFPDLCRKLHVLSGPKEPADFFLNTFLQTLAHRGKNNIKRNDFVSMLLGLKDSLTDKELAAESFLVFAAGSETSKTLIVFTLYELALNPEIQQSLREEIKTALKENDGKLTYESLFGLKYLDQVINESLRKYPPIPRNVRKCTEDYEIPGTSLIIPQGTSIELPTYSLQNDPEYYPEPEKFDPERFSPENIKNRDPFTFMPFGHGPRNCIGMRFGLMKSKLAVVKLLQNFEIFPTDKTPIPMKFVPSSIFLAPVGGMWLRLKKVK